MYFEVECRPASQWQHELDRKLHAKAVEKSWSNTVQLGASQHDLIEFVPVGVASRPIVSENPRGASKPRTRESKPFPFVV